VDNKNLSDEKKIEEALELDKKLDFPDEIGSDEALEKLIDSVVKLEKENDDTSR
jgi:hypothetical protein